MKRALAFILLAGLLVTCSAHAAGLSELLSWSAPTAYSDGTALPSSDLGFYVVLVSSPCNPSQEYVVAAPATSVTVTGLGNGDYYASMVFITSATAHLPNAYSAWQTIEFSPNNTLCPSAVHAVSVQ